MQKIMRIDYNFCNIFFQLLWSILYIIFNQTVSQFYSIVKRNWLMKLKIIFQKVHIIIVYNIWKKIYIKIFKNIELKDLLWKAANAIIKSEFNIIFEKMKQLESKCETWFTDNVDFEHWAESHFIERWYDWSSYLKYCKIIKLVTFNSSRKINTCYVWRNSTSINALICRTTTVWTSNSRTSSDSFQKSSKKFSIVLILHLDDIVICNQWKQCMKYYH